jgi:hypothetical protein
MEPKNYNAANNWTYTVKQTVDWFGIYLLINPDPYREARELIERIKES